MDELLLFQKRKRQKIETGLHNKETMWHQLPYGIFMKIYEIDGVKHRFTIDSTNGTRSPIEKLIGNEWKRI